MCIVSYAVNFLLLYYVWIIRKRFADESVFSALRHDLVYLWANKKRWAVSLLPMLIIMVCLPFVFPPYWQLKAPQPSAEVAIGITPDGHPWIGAENPELTIIEYTDYQCFQCKKMHFFLRNIVNAHFDKIRLEHRHFPMDHQVNPIVKKPFHVGSGAMALISIYAASRNKFWPVNDYLFNAERKHSQIDLREISKKFDLNAKEMAVALKHRGIRNILMDDIRQGMKLGITGTPGYVIDGELHLARIPPEILKEYIQ
jgi:protein-disulfide isomerase